jgi:2,5-diketo-D-gluconate reductase A
VFALRATGENTDHELIHHAGSTYFPPRRHRDPPAGLRGLSGPAPGNGRGHGPGTTGGLPPHRHGGGIWQRGLNRDEVFITTKCFNDDHGYEPAIHAAKASLKRLELEHIDLYLIHWPVPLHNKYVETWEAFIELQAQGLVRSIGVSNFQPAHLERIIAETGVTPAVNQVELHPSFQQTGLRHEHQQLGIVTEAWSPLAQGAVLEDPAILEIARAHEKTPAQIVIRWHLQLGNVVIPKSVTPARIEENFAVFDFALSDAEMASIEQLDAGDRTGPDPDTFVRP